MSVTTKAPAAHPHEPGEQAALGPPVPELLPPDPSLDALRKAAAQCQACHLYLHAAQTVFGEGLPQARLVLVGEQPGDKEDQAGRPFVGPAGQLLDRALEVAGIGREDAYVTNVVKHFKWTPRGKRRIHAKPDAREIGACHPWLDAELELLRPRVVVALGATAAQAMLGSSFKVTRQRGEFFDYPPDAQITATVHPSSILRGPDEETRALGFDSLVRDLEKVRHVLDS